MGYKQINSTLLLKMIQAGAGNLSNHKALINELNVFPVPDGDTGTNMNLSMQSGVQAMQKVEEEAIPKLLQQYVNGLLMGARGNSGVILSQLFKGFQEAIGDTLEINAEIFVQALEGGVKKAYKAVTNPVEGTILTVAKDAATAGRNIVGEIDDLTELMAKVVDGAKTSLKHTPELLPILKEVGVVDSGGKGLQVIYEGFLAALRDEEVTNIVDEIVVEAQIEQEHHKAVQSFMSADEIEYGYCTEFFVEFTAEKLQQHPFDEAQFRHQLSEFGDSLLVASTEEMVKIHIHTEYPGKVMTIAQDYGDLMKIDIENMRKQHEALTSDTTPNVQSSPEVAVLAVAMGSGMKELMTSMGATSVITGGQTMNPSTEDILQAVNRTGANTVYILPNNKNILLAANQVRDLTDKHIVVIPTKSIPQGIGALFAFNIETDIETNEHNMLEALEDIKTGQITYATRDTVINGMSIHKNAYIGMNDDTIISTNNDKIIVLQQLVDQLIGMDDELLTVFFGEDVTGDEADHLKQYLEEALDIDIEYHFGNQPLYPYILMVE